MKYIQMTDPDGAVFDSVPSSVGFWEGRGCTVLGEAPVARYDGKGNLLPPGEPEAPPAPETPETSGDDEAPPAPEAPADAAGDGPEPGEPAPAAVAG